MDTRCRKQHLSDIKMDRKEKKRLFLSSVSTIEEGVPLVLHDNVTDNKAIEPDQDKGNEGESAPADVNAGAAQVLDESAL